jgi:isocitrate/isopropylmalate dehydrogenase
VGRRIAVIPGDRVGREVVPGPVERAIDAVCEDGRVLTADVGGKASTAEVGNAVVQALR